MLRATKLWAGAVVDRWRLNPQRGACRLADGRLTALITYRCGEPAMFHEDWLPDGFAMPRWLYVQPITDRVWADLSPWSGRRDGRRVGSALP